MAAVTFSRLSAPVTAFAPAIYRSPAMVPEAKVFTGSMSRAFFTGGLDGSEIESIQAGVRLLLERATLEAEWKHRVLNPELPRTQLELTKTAKSVMAALTKFG